MGPRIGLEVLEKGRFVGPRSWSAGFGEGKVCWAPELVWRFWRREGLLGPRIGLEVLEKGRFVGPRSWSAGFGEGKVCWAPELVCRFWRRKTLLSLPDIEPRFLGRPVRMLVTAPTDLLDSCASV